MAGARDPGPKHAGQRIPTGMMAPSECARRPAPARWSAAFFLLEISFWKECRVKNQVNLAKDIMHVFSVLCDADNEFLNIFSASTIDKYTKAAVDAPGTLGALRFRYYNRRVDDRMALLLVLRLCSAPWGGFNRVPTPTPERSRSRAGRAQTCRLPTSLAPAGMARARVTQARPFPESGMSSQKIGSSLPVSAFGWQEVGRQGEPAVAGLGDAPWALGPASRGRDGESSFHPLPDVCRAVRATREGREVDLHTTP